MLSICKDALMAAHILKRLSSIALSALLWCLAVSILIQNLFVLRENRRLRATLVASVPILKEGRELRSLSGLTLGGRIQGIPFPQAGDGPLLIITFSPGCPACRANQPGWVALAAELKKLGSRVAWVSRDSIESTLQYCVDEEIDLADVFVDPPYRTYSQLALQVVPQTVVVGASGRVQKVWVGQLDPTGWKEVFRFFGAREPQVLREPVT